MSALGFQSKESRFIQRPKKIPKKDVQPKLFRGYTRILCGGLVVVARLRTGKAGQIPALCRNGSSNPNRFSKSPNARSTIGDALAYEHRWCGKGQSP